MNRRELLRQALESVRRQTRPCLEVIVIDAGDDGSDLLCTEYGFVRYVRQQTKGLTAARNEALQLVKGDYVGMLDSDDYYEPEFLEACAGLLDSGAEVAYSQGFRVTGRGRAAILANHRLPRNLLAALVQDNFVIASFALQRRLCLERIGGYRLGLPLADDFDLYLRLALEGCRFAHVGRPLSNRRHHDGSLTLSNPDSNVRAIFEIVDYNYPALCQQLGWTRARLLSLPEMRLGQLYFELGHFAVASEHFRKAVEGDPYFWRARLFGWACRTGPLSSRLLKIARGVKELLLAPLRRLGLMESRW